MLKTNEDVRGTCKLKILMNKFQIPKSEPKVQQLHEEILQSEDVRGIVDGIHRQNPSLM